MWRARHERRLAAVDQRLAVLAGALLVAIFGCERPTHLRQSFPGSTVQEQLDRKITELGGSVGSLWQEDSTEIVLGDSWQGGNEKLTLLRQYAGVGELTIAYPEFDDAALQQIATLRYLSALHLLGTQVTPEGLLSLGQASQLVLLHLEGENVTDDSLAALKALHLKWLIVEPGSRITDKGLTHLKGHASLMYLRLPDARLSGAGFAALGPLPELRDLDVSHTDIDDDDLIHLGGNKKLSRLDLSGTQVTGTGLAHLAGCSRLRELILDGAPITDANLAQANRLPVLESLSLIDTSVTDAGLALLAGSKTLVTVGLKDTQTTDAGLELLSRMPRLRTVRNRDGSIVVFEAIQRRWAKSFATTSGSLHRLTGKEGERVFLWTDDGPQEVEPREERQEPAPEEPARSPLSHRETVPANQRPPAGAGASVEPSSV